MNEWSPDFETIEGFRFRVFRFRGNTYCKLADFTKELSVKGVSTTRDLILLKSFNQYQAQNGGPYRVLVVLDDKTRQVIRKRSKDVANSAKWSTGTETIENHEFRVFRFDHDKTYLIQLDIVRGLNSTTRTIMSHWGIATLVPEGGDIFDSFTIYHHSHGRRPRLIELNDAKQIIKRVLKMPLERNVVVDVTKVKMRHYQFPAYLFQGETYICLSDILTVLKLRVDMHILGRFINYVPRVHVIRSGPVCAFLRAFRRMQTGVPAGGKFMTFFDVTRVVDRILDDRDVERVRFAGSDLVMVKFRRRSYITVADIANNFGIHVSELLKSFHYQRVTDQDVLDFVGVKRAMAQQITSISVRHIVTPECAKRLIRLYQGSRKKMSEEDSEFVPEEEDADPPIRFKRQRTGMPIFHEECVAVEKIAKALCMKRTVLREYVYAQRDLENPVKDRVSKQTAEKIFQRLGIFDDDEEEDSSSSEEVAQAPPPVFNFRERVEVQSQGTWYPAEIVCKTDDGDYGVMYDKTVGKTPPIEKVACWQIRRKGAPD